MYHRQLKIASNVCIKQYYEPTNETIEINKNNETVVLDDKSLSVTIETLPHKHNIYSYCNVPRDMNFLQILALNTYRLISLNHILEIHNCIVNFNETCNFYFLIRTTIIKTKQNVASFSTTICATIMQNVLFAPVKCFYNESGLFFTF
jgi:hypothetical protein